jgi:hypothetical protein
MALILSPVDTTVSAAADSFSMVKDLLVPLLIGAVGGVAALVGQILIQRRELSHAVGTELWKERVQVYRDFMAAMSGLHLASAEHPSGLKGVAPEGRRQVFDAFLAAYGRMAPIASRPTQDAVVGFFNGLQVLLSGDTKAIGEFFEGRALSIVNAMRRDLFMGELDTTKRLWDGGRIAEYVRENSL